VWDTQTQPNNLAVFTGLSVTAEVKDGGSAVHQSVDRNQTADNADHNQRLFDLVPFMTGFRRSGSNAAAQRTKWGQYTVSRGTNAAGDNGDVLIVQGYNLKTPAYATALKVGGEAATADGNQSVTEMRFKLGNGIGSGEVELTAKTSKGADQLAANNITTHSAQSLNHGNTWNSEATGAAWTSRWNDRRNLRIWESAQRFGGDSNGSASGASDHNGTTQSSAGATYAAATVAPNSRDIYGSWNKEGNNAVYFGRDNGTTGYQVWWMSDPSAETDIAVGSTLKTPHPSNGLDSSMPTVTVVYNAIGSLVSPAWRQESGGIFVWDVTQNRKDVFNQHLDWGGDRWPGTGYSVGYAYIVEKVWRTFADWYTDFDAITDRFMNPHVAVNGDYIHVVYHDRIDRSLKYWWNKSGSAATLNQYTATTSSDGKLSPGSANATSTIDGAAVKARRWINLDGGFNSYDDGYDYTSGTTYNAASNDGRVRNPAGRVADHNGLGTDPAPAGKNAAGEFNAIDFTSDGYPVIAYYDMKNDKLKIAYANSARPLAGTNWDVQTVDTNITGVEPATGLGFSAGQYVSMRIDRGVTPNRIHIAFFRSNTGELVYLQGTRSGNAYAFAADSCVAVDSTGTTGKWADISLDRSGNPWITYQDISRAGTLDAVKMAYLPDAKDHDNTRYKNPDNWETMHVPSRYRAEDARLSIENPLDSTDSGWDAAVGYQSDYFRIAYFHK
jgi:hypothetical protein